MFRCAAVAVLFALLSANAASAAATDPVAADPTPAEFAQAASTLARVPESEVNRRLGEALGAASRANLFSGVVEIAHHGKVIFQGAYGVADRDYGVPNRLDTRFNLASANKMFTAVAIEQLIAAGKLKPEDPIANWIDDSWLPREVAQTITVDQLLTHTSGLGSYFNDRFEHAARRDLKDIDDFKPLVHDEKTSFAPGRGWDYSNIGFLLLGVIVEKVSGETYDDYIAQHVTGPLGMTATAPLDLEQVNPGIAVGYHKVRLKPAAPAPAAAAASPSEPEPMGLPPYGPTMRDADANNREVTAGGFAWRNNLFRHVIRGGPAGGWYTTAGDMVRFLDGLQSGRLVDPATLAAMRRPTPLFAGYGRGLMLEGDAYGHGGGFYGISTAAFALPGGYELVILANDSTGVGTGYATVMDALSTAAR